MVLYIALDWDQIISVEDSEWFHSIMLQMRPRTLLRLAWARDRKAYRKDSHDKILVVLFAC